MLSDTSKDVIRATLPAVGAAIGDITPLFYRKMFAAHPELERDLFNRGNQRQGDQQKALAGAIAGFATLQLEPDPARMQMILSRIAHKHASLGITADQYQIVHKYLFEAIVEVLGDAVTAEVAAGVGRGVLADGRHPDRDGEGPLRGRGCRRRRRVARGTGARTALPVRRHGVVRPHFHRQ